MIGDQPVILNDSQIVHKSVRGVFTVSYTCPPDHKVLFVHDDQSGGIACGIEFNDFVAAATYTVVGDEVPYAFTFAVEYTMEVQLPDHRSRIVWEERPARRIYLGGTTYDFDAARRAFRGGNPQARAFRRASRVPDNLKYLTFINCRDHELHFEPFAADDRQVSLTNAGTPALEDLRAIWDVFRPLPAQSHPAD